MRTVLSHYILGVICDAATDKSHTDHLRSTKHEEREKRKFEKVVHQYFKKNLDKEHKLIKFKAQLYSTDFCVYQDNQ